jgi:hypothetical protein
MLYYFKKVLCYLHYAFGENKTYKFNNKILPYKFETKLNFKF